ncbi:MAG: trypsin-like peptidase domain-containing protein [Deltaproteobacteria bacterium]|nr:trypsin-like peptidase domain-containing protein [Deltaproteobacteria bacterium]
MLRTGLGAGFGLCALLSGALLAGDEPERLWAELPSSAPAPVDLSTFSELVERASPAVVAVHTRLASGELAEPAIDPWDLFPDVPRRERPEGMGSGFAVRADGYVVTNHHVIENAEQVWVRVQGLGKRLEAKVVGSDARSDLALLKVAPPRPLAVLPLGDSDRLRVGAWVVAIGNPLGLTSVATKGIVSGKGRTVGDLPQIRPGYFDFIQTDAAIDRGNSGGPLLNLRGEVVGVNTAINSRARGIGFAVPVNVTKAVLPQLLEHGRVERSYLGITIEEVTWEQVEALGMDRPRGVRVTSVKPDTPAERAGLREGDVVLRFAGAEIHSRADMGWRAGTCRVGVAVELSVSRGGERRTMQIVPAARDRDAEPAPPERPDGGQKPTPTRRRLGLEVGELDAHSAKLAGLDEAARGVVVTRAAGEAAAQGLRLGDVITEINGRPVADRKSFLREIESVGSGEMVRLYVLRQRGARFFAFPRNW